MTDDPNETLASLCPTMITLLMSLTMLIFPSDLTLVSVALPTIGQDLRIPPEHLSWVISAYSTMLAGFMIIGGRLTDAFGQRRCLIIGILSFMVGSGLAALSGNIWMLIAARAVEGAGGAVMMPASFSLIQAFLPEGAARHRALGVFQLMQGLALAGGPVLGGVLTNSVGWRAVFVVNLPILAASLFLTIRFLPSRARDASEGGAFDDIGGAALLAIGTGLLLAALSNLGEHGLNSGLGLTLLATALLDYIALAALETRHPSPITPIRLLRDANLVGGGLAVMGLIAGFGTVLLLLSLYLQNGLHVSATGTGFRMLPIAGAVLASAPCAPIFMKRWSLRTVAIGAMVLEISALLLLVLKAPSGVYLTVVAPLVFLSVFGGAMAMVALLGMSVADVSDGDQGAATGLIFTGEQIGVPMGIVVALAVLQALPAAGTKAALAAYGRAFLVPVLSVGLGLVAITVLTQGSSALRSGRASRARAGSPKS